MISHSYSPSYTPAEPCSTHPKRPALHPYFSGNPAPLLRLQLAAGPASTCHPGFPLGAHVPIELSGLSDDWQLVDFPVGDFAFQVGPRIELRHLAAGLDRDRGEGGGLNFSRFSPWGEVSTVLLKQLYKLLHAYPGSSDKSPQGPPVQLLVVWD